MLSRAYNNATTHDAQRARALNNSYLCYFLAVLVMAGTAWVIWDGITAMEPDSPARNSKIYQNLVLLVLEGFLFSLAGQYKKYAFWLRVLGWGIFALQIVLMTLANYSVGATAGKAAALNNLRVQQIVAQADAQRSDSAALRESAAKQAKSKHSWVNVEGGKAATAAAQQTASAAGAADQLAKIQVSAPIVDKIGEGGLMALSGALALITECVGIALMHYGGCLRNDALAAGPAIDVQTLDAVLQVLDALGVDAPAPAPVLDAPAPALDAPADALMVRRKSELGRLLLPKTSKPSKPGASDLTHQAPRGAGAGASELTQQDQTGASELTQPVTRKAPVRQRKSTAVAAGAKCDTGIGQNDGARYRRVKAAIEARTLEPGLRAIQAAEGGGAPTVRGYLAAMCAENLIRQKADGTYELIGGAK